jgi:hypothetical protein
VLASSSSPTAHAGPVVGCGPDNPSVEPDADLLAALGGVPDPRGARRRRHRLVTVLAVSVCAVLAGAPAYVAIAEGAHGIPVSARLRVGIRRWTPSEWTIRRILQAVDRDVLDAVLSSWLPPGSPIRRPTGCGWSRSVSAGLLSRRPLPFRRRGASRR